jgi:chromate transporter
MNPSMLTDLFLHFGMLSLLSIGGVLATAPEMNRYLVGERGWMSGDEFTGSIALAQAAPGPNMLFVTLLGWQAAGLPGALAATVGTLLPSSLLALFGGRWVRSHEAAPLVVALRLGLSPIAIGLTAAAGWVVAAGAAGGDWRSWALTAAAAAVMLGTRINLLWVIGGGAALGALGWIG